MTDIRNTDDVIDSRDVIARIEELESDRADYVLGAPDGSETAAPELWAQNEPDDAAELAALEALAEEGESYAEDWRYGAQLIHESYFEDYCKQLVEDIGDLPRNLPDYIAIDWSATADNVRVDYTEVDFDGETYLVR